MARILFVERNFNPETPIVLNKAGHEVFVVKEEIPDVHTFDRSALIQTIKDLKIDVLVVGLKFQIDKEILDLRIKAVFTRTTGLDHIDTDYCKEKGIEVIPLVGSELTDVVAVPELCLWAMLELIRKRGGRELRGKTLGIIGFGRIGRQLGKYAIKLGMNLLTHADYSPNFEPIDISEFRFTCPFVSKKEILSKSDIVSLNISSTEENRNFFDRIKFEQMKDGAYFLNSSRGWLVDESALQWALESGKLAGAWSDFPVGFSHPNLLVTNHEGGKTLESSIATEVIIVHKLIGWLKNK